MAPASFATVLCGPTTARAAAQAPAPSKPVMALKRVATSLGAAAVVLTSAAAPVMAADLALGAEVFNNNCGPEVQQPRFTQRSGPDPFMHPRKYRGMLLWDPVLNLRQHTRGHPFVTGSGPAPLLLHQAACHQGGLNSVIPERTLQKAALEQYLAGGFNVDAIITQVTNGKGAMPAWGDRLDEEEIEAVANYVFDQATGSKW